MTGIVKRIEDDLDQWANHRVTPLFVFDGQVVEGQDEISRMRGRKALEQTQKAWDLYFGNQAIEAVTTFGSNIGAIRPETLYSVLQKILRKRQLHFLVAPYNAAAQIAYLDMIDSNQCAGIMGSQELFLYPIKDCVLRSMNWEKKSVSAISKNYLLRALNVSEPLFVDALLTTGTSFLTRFPALLEPSVVKSESPNVKDAVNLLRATDKSVAVACSSFNDFVQAQDPLWLDKFRKGINSADSIVTLTIWRFLHLRDYISDAHTLTKWGNALATAMEALKPTVDKNPDVGNLYEQLLVAFELIRFDLLNSKNKHEELQGLPMNGTEEDKASLLLVSRCASLLKLRHESIGYTGPLSKNLLHFRSLASEVRSADRDLTEAILASTFLRGQSERERDDYFEISQRYAVLAHRALDLPPYRSVWTNNAQSGSPSSTTRTSRWALLSRLTLTISCPRTRRERRKTRRGSSQRLICHTLSTSPEIWRLLAPSSMPSMRV
ncbi:PIN domain-like protein [Coniochaeta sp. PMI_546]|nr:PIN domain-like protein [Coniochaeta sp. PMI_546]